MLASFADPLIMENGRDLIDMICTSYESPVTDGDEDQYNFSMPPPLLILCFVQICHVSSRQCNSTVLPCRQLQSGSAAEGGHVCERCNSQVPVIPIMMDHAWVCWHVIQSMWT